MRVLFFTWSYYPAPAGGAERQAKLQAEELTRRGHVVTVVCPRTSRETSGPIENVYVRRLFRIDARPLRRLSYLCALLGFSLAHIRSFDVVHIHLANLQADVIVPCALLMRRPVYIKVACGGEVGEVQRLAKVALLTRWFGLRHASCVQALSQEIVEELKSIGVPSRRIISVPNGLDYQNFAPAGPREKASLRKLLGLPEAAIIVLFAGRFARYKGLHELFAVWRTMNRPTHALLLLVGSADVDDGQPDIENGADLLVRGWTNEIRNYLRAADVFVYPSYADGMSNALLEAMSCGLAIVATRSGAAEEMIDHGASGLLFDARDQHALDASLTRVLVDSRFRKELGRCARARAGDYSIEFVVDRIEAAYMQMMRGAP
ncbi:MAG: glycosyltransferase family 4 protein [Actinobacteria bacterium]|nr:glycosyltransferase family 4 protein [Actinomycetota bacterium]